jgi:hypothetical protein
MAYNLVSVIPMYLFAFPIFNEMESFEIITTSECFLHIHGLVAGGFSLRGVNRSTMASAVTSMPTKLVCSKHSF